ncbi:hypothetical protein AB6A40_000520 [Gnathostoma spinigerum]|uniref:Uncharacterized protein n=1 Tax=Gnathostoma spinigerum TaxID=75299 RepID=A0ABD6E8X9_9BILA
MCKIRLCHNIGAISTGVRGRWLHDHGDHKYYKSETIIGVWMGTAGSITTKTICIIRTGSVGAMIPRTVDGICPKSIDGITLETIGNIGLMASWFQSSEVEWYHLHRDSRTIGLTLVQYVRAPLVNNFVGHRRHMSTHHWFRNLADHSFHF